MKFLDLIKLALLISSILISFLSVAAYICVIPLFKKVRDIETAILEKKKDINKLPKKILKKLSGRANQAQFEKIVIKEKKPLLYDLDILQTRRHFLLDKLPLLSFFKK